MSKFWFPPNTLPAPTGTPDVAEAGDRVSSSVYVFDKDHAIERAVNVAGVTGRPLLVDGPSGCGKTSLAYYVAWAMQWQLHLTPITSRTQSTDLMYSIDQLKRLQDAQARDLKEISAYIQPGVLWKGFDPKGASKRTASAAPKVDATTSKGLPVPGSGSVILIDEIDKADPDVPNNLLLALGSYQFDVAEIDVTVYAQQVPFIVLTTNNERKLPPAFLRRCVHLTLPAPDVDRLIEAGRKHQAGSDSMITSIARLFTDPASAGHEGPASIAEYLDAVRACESLGVDPATEDWRWVRSIVMGRARPAGVT